MTHLVSQRLIIFKFCPWFSLFPFVWLRGTKVTAILRRSSSRGLCTPEVKIASVPVPAFTGNQMASSNLQIREEEQPPDRPEPSQIARDRSLKQTKSKYKTRGIGHLTWKKTYYITGSWWSHQSVSRSASKCYRQRDVLHCLQRSCFIKKMHFVIPFYHAIVSPNILNVILASYILTH